MRIAIVYNEPKPSTPQEHWLSRSSSEGTIVAETFTDASEYGVLQETQLIEGFLRDGGYETMLYAADDPSGLVEFLTRERPDLIFNCCETFRGDSRLEMNVAAIFEILGIPFTGSPALTLGMALDKSVAKAMFVSHGVPTPPWAVISPHDGWAGAGRLRFPVIVKPLQEDASTGIDMHSIVENPASLMERVRFVWDEFGQPSLAEEFIDGRELNVAVLAVAPEQFVALPISEILFSGFPSQKHHILTYEAKWMVDSPYYSSSMPRCPAELSPELAEQVRSIALKAAAAVQLRDYGRIDFRVRASDGAVFVLEANPNPDITFDSGFVRAAQASGRTHASVILEIVERAKERRLEGDSGR
jgi:D-alanine-D-alanine ligase